VLQSRELKLSNLHPLGLGEEAVGIQKGSTDYSLKDANNVSGERRSTAAKRILERIRRL